MMLVSIPCWVLGTFLGAALGALLPEVLLKAAGVALYAMFIAVIVLPARKSRKILLVCLAAMAMSWLLSALTELSAGLRVAIVALVLSGAAAWLPAGREDAHA
jgi:predicted branched-subunit amino acid permease